MTDPSAAFLLIRRSDGLTYRFERITDTRGAPRYRRDDGLVTCLRHPVAGWCVVGPDGRPNGWPVIRYPTRRPTPGPWRSWRNGRSYLYDLVFTDPG